MNRKRRLSVSLFLAICIVGIFPCAILGHAFLENYESKAVESRTQIVMNQCLILANHLYLSGYMDDTGIESVNSELAQLSNLYDGRVLIINNDLKIIKDTYSQSVGKYMISQEVVKCLGGESLSKYDSRNHYLEIATPIANRAGTEYLGVMLTSVSTDEITSIMSSMRNKATFLIFAVAAVVIGVGFFCTHALLKPFSQLTQKINDIKEGFGENEITGSTYKETESITDAFNQLIHKMKALDDSRQEFVSNVSHELKTPITSVKVLAESLLQMNEVPNEMYREFMEDIVNEVDREDKIINDLLELVKLDKEGATLRIDNCDIEILIASVIKRLMPIANAAGIELIFETVRPVTADVDATKLSLALTNIIENGIKYNREGGSVKIILDAQPMFFNVTISDTGIGIPEEDLPNVFERFYRVDKSHSREIGGTGLGLSIARNAILMHQGAVKVESEPNVGTVFNIKIPINYIVKAEENENRSE